MKTLVKKAGLLGGLMLFSVMLAYSQEQDTDIRQGQVFVLMAPSGNEYQHLDFPRKNMLIKKGAIPSPNYLVGEKVYVHEILKSDSKNLEVYLKRSDGQKFYRFIDKVKAYPRLALEAGEIRYWKPSKKEAIVQQ